VVGEQARTVAHETLQRRYDVPAQDKHGSLDGRPDAPEKQVRWDLQSNIPGVQDRQGHNIDVCHEALLLQQIGDLDQTVQAHRALQVHLVHMGAIKELQQVQKQTHWRDLHIDLDACAALNLLVFFRPKDLLGMKLARVVTQISPPHPQAGLQYLPWHPPPWVVCAALGVT